MSAQERAASSIDPVSSIEGIDSNKKDKDDDRKRRRAALRLINNESHEEPKEKEPKKSLFRLALDPEDLSNKEKPKLAEEFDNETALDSIDDTTETEETTVVPPEVPLEELSSEERIEAAQMIATQEIDVLAEEPENDEADAVVHDALYSYYAKVLEDGMEPETARNEVFSEYDIDPEDVDITQTNNEDTEQERSIENNEMETDLSGENDEGEMPLNANTTEAAQPVIGSAANVSPVAASGGGANRRPPAPPSGGGGSRRGGGNNRPPRPNPWRSTRNTPNPLPTAGILRPRSYNHIKKDHHDYWSGFMTGGALGYFIGHRRGRIKTEKKLKTVKKSLEKQIKKVDKEVKSHDYAIRKLVREKAVASPVSLKTKERPLVIKQEVVADRPPKPKALHKELHAPIPVPATEIHLGRLVMAETPKEAAVREQIRSEVRMRAPETLRHESSAKEQRTLRPETMSSSELLKESEKIIIDGTSLRQIYESQLVGEKGLRRLVAEFMRGGNLKAALKREVVERQIDFERDPIMRDMASSGSNPSESSQTSLEQMIKRAESSLAISQEEVAFLKAKAAHEGKEKVKQYQHTRAINAVFLAIITSLIIVIILLGFLRHN